MSQSRQLAAIMFADIVGYTALMGQDEEKAFLILNKNRALQKPIIEEFNGRWIKELGDGVIEQHDGILFFLKQKFKVLPGLKKDPRMDEIIAKFGLPE